MKKVYMPTMDELYLMQDKTNGHSMYKYILIKAIESLIMDGTIHNNKGILKTTYKYLRENPDIAYAICRLYPREIEYSEYAQNDIKLCQELISGKTAPDSSIYTLDNLAYFESGIGVLSNNIIATTTVQTLAEKLPVSPRYRFEYKQPNSLLDSIFACELSEAPIASAVSEELIRIEPAYAIKLGADKLGISIPSEQSTLLVRGVNTYAQRYGIELATGSQYFGKDVLTTPDADVKKLLKCIKEHRIK